MAKLKAGIIGAGGITDYHINGYRRAGVDILAIADPQVERAEIQAKKFNIPKAFSSYEEMLKKIKEIDVVSICIPNKFHASISIECLKMDKHVFCEKPPALNANEIIQMVNAAKDANKILMFDFNNRARPESQALMKYINDGTVGKINSAQALWIRRCGIPGFGGWFTQKNLSGGGPVIDLLHMIDLSLYFMKFPQPKWIIAQTFNDFSTNPEFKGPWGIPDVKDGIMDVETSAHAFIKFQNNEVLFVRNSWAEMNKREEVSVTFQGKKAGGMIKRLFEKDGIDETAIDECELYTQENGHPVNRNIIVEPDEKMGRELAVINFVNSILHKEEPFSKPEEAIILMKIIDAIYFSSEKGVPVEIN